MKNAMAKMKNPTGSIISQPFFELKKANNIAIAINKHKIPFKKSIVFINNFHINIYLIDLLIKSHYKIFKSLSKDI